MAGEENRKIFFNDRSLGLSEGYSIFLGGIPRLEDIKYKTDDVSVFIKRLLLLFRRERINEGAPTVYAPISILILNFASVFPLLLEDVGRRMKDWGSEGRLNPFNEVYDVSCTLRYYTFMIT